MHRNERKPGVCLIVHHVLRGCAEFLVPFYHLVDRVEEVLLGHGFPASSDGVHAGFCADTPDVGT